MEMQKEHDRHKYNFTSTKKTSAIVDIVNVIKMLLGEVKIWRKAKIDKIEWQRAVRAHQKRKRAEITKILSSGRLTNLIYCGDSHVEMSAKLFSFDEIIDAGIVGSTISDCANVMNKKSINIKANFAVLIIGTNDIISSKSLKTHMINKARKDLRIIVRKLHQSSKFVLVAALPPAKFAGSVRRSPIAVETYSHMIKEVCARESCIYFDPFESIRSERFGVAIPDVFLDAVHLNDYALLTSQIELKLNDIMLRHSTALNDNSNNARSFQKYNLR